MKTPIRKNLTGLAIYVYTIGILFGGTHTYSFSSGWMVAGYDRNSNSYAPRRMPVEEDFSK